MEFSALLTSAGINIALCILYLSLYSILRKQPHNFRVYFGRRLAEEKFREQVDYFSFERLLPTAGWLVKAYWCTEDEIRRVAGLDSVVFLRLFIFSIRIFSITTLICVFGVLPVNYNGQEMAHTRVPAESLNVFTIANLKEGSSKLWVHCTALYVITISACILLFQEYRYISRKRLAHITGSTPNPGHFAVLVRSIPKSHNELLDDTIRNFFLNYHGSSYLSHQMIYRKGKLQNFVDSAERAYRKFVRVKLSAFDQNMRSSLNRCGLCGVQASSFELYRNKFVEAKKSDLTDPEVVEAQKDCPGAIVFFKTRYAAIVASQVLQSSNPMLWVTNLAPEPRDVYWSNLWIPYRQIWLRKIATLAASVFFMFVFIVPVAFVQSMMQLEQLKQMFPNLRGALKTSFCVRVVTGYLPSVVLLLSLYTVPPLMMRFSAIEGSISRSGRKTSACTKILIFNIWNVFFVNVLSGSVLNQLNVLTRPKDMPSMLAELVPKQATFFMTYVLTSGWFSLCSEILQVYNLVYNFFRKFICCYQDEPEYVYSFPYHTEVPKVLMFNVLGFTFSIMAPLILPFLLVYFCLGYLVYRNQILNVYYPKYEMGGKLWPIMHNTMVFSLVLTQIIALGVFTIKKAPISTGFTILLLIGTILFNEYCRQRFSRIFNSFSAQDFIELDREDEQSGRMREIHEHLLDAYCQSPPGSADEIPMEMIMEDPAQEASNSSQELCDTVQEVAGSIIQEHIEERHGSSSGRR
ncbi:CSC1-like protein RXW8 [Aegilops tauschii subsp. strangulata]|uniref:CSC1-like protein RXW8 n=3 Tax=Triticinae TaxID=1648030 RepID=A0A453H9U4_AEGTS|nr:CSC1-like protein RXW8 [Aegilops tauschii subsp. strangulata]XP_044373471.1 CSC1-like protein RXW8 [Triticum aestivum]